MVWTVSDIPPGYGASAIVTGAGGLGYETGLALARAGYDVVLAGRNPARGQDSIARIREAAPGASITFEMLDLASLASVERFAERLGASHTKLDLLVNNAGVMTPPVRGQTEDGFELQFGTNFLGHFALTLRLVALLQRAAAPRVVSVSSIAHKQGKIDFADLQTERPYRPFRAYAQSKLAMLMFALELDRRARAAGSALLSMAAHPGVALTDLFSNGPGTKGIAAMAGRVVLPLIGHSASAGAVPILFAATAPEAKSGGYYGPQGFLELKGPSGDAAIAQFAKDAGVSARLWEVSENLTGLTPHFVSKALAAA